MKYILFSLLVLFAIPVLASQTEIIYDSPYIVATNSPVTLKIAPTSDLYADNCVMYAKYVLGRSEAWGVAKDIETNSSRQEVGGVVLTTEGRFGHVAVITRITETHILVSEANYIPDTISTRSIPIDDPRIKGYLVLE